MRSYRNCTATGMFVPQQLSGSLILLGWPCLDGHFLIIPVIQSHLSHCFYVTVDSLGLRRNGSPP